MPSPFLPGRLRELRTEAGLSQAEDQPGGFIEVPAGTGGRRRARRGRGCIRAMSGRC